MSHPEPESELLHDWRFTTNQFVMATSPLRPTTRKFIFQLNTCGYSTYVTSSLTKGWICLLQLLLDLASAVILRSESRGTHDHILLSQIRDFPNLEGRVPVFMSLRNRVARLYPQAVGSLFIASRDSQGYGGGIRPRLHTRFFYYWWGGTKSLGTAATSSLLYKPQMIDEGDCGAIGGMKIGRGNRSTRRKPAPAPPCTPQIPHDQTRARTSDRRGGKPATNRLSYGAASTRD
jgi:hypothetical protein